MTAIQNLNRALLRTLMSPAVANIVADRLEELEREKTDVVRALEIKAQANENAAKRSPEQAAWSNGVAFGMREAIALLSNTQSSATPNNGH
jgi:hypothetical protein